ncbi:MAG TPA: DUF1828 domain-containing protein [Methanocorpusculum sp.]|nr:DUF1828 domain-containing protein [Methanocorpusculum sp.]
MVTDINELIHTYADWISDQIKVRNIGEYEEITTPFLDRHNDWIQIYLKEITENKYVLTDGGYTLQDLANCGVAIETERRRNILLTNIAGFGVVLKNENELTIEATKSNYPQKKHNLIQAILAVNDMVNISTSSTMQLFSEDVKTWMRKNNVRFNEKMEVTGKSGLSHKFDIVIPPSLDGNYPERFIQPYNSLSYQQIRALAFDWCDIKDERDAQLIVIFNSNQKLSKKIQEVCDICNITTASFNEIESISQMITA